MSFLVLLCITWPFLSSFWGFFAHKRINYLAVFTLPPEMIGFYKKNITYITEASVDPDRRRYAVEDEGMKHYIDIDHYGEDAIFTIPRSWDSAVSLFGEDTLRTYGILPWHLQSMYYQLKDAFMVKDPARILRLSAELGHYLGDANVPLHTTENYNGQLTGQVGIHSFWESRLPELFSDEYDFLVGRATYLIDIQKAGWECVEQSHLLTEQVLRTEKELSLRMEGRKYSFETKGQATAKVYSSAYSKAYHNLLDGMVEARMQNAIKMVGSFWYTAWVDAGQPDLKELIDFSPSEAELEQHRRDLELWKQQQAGRRLHDAED